jgi:cytochrome b involved in lipid metabolism
MKKLPLSEVKKNDKDTDPYGLGEVATEFIVANVGIEKLLAIYAALGQGKTFAQAFEAGTGVKLDDFYSMFEESRSTLGVPLGVGGSANASPSPAPSATPTPSPSATPTPKTSETSQAKYTLADVKKHSTDTDCWAAVDGAVYDLTKWAALHPGGPAIIRSLCGRDATSDFQGRHANQADPARELSNYLIGKLD